MTSSRACLWAVCAACVLHVGEAAAVMVAGGRGAAGPPRNVAPAPPAASPSVELIAGTIAAVDRAKRTMTVSGTQLGWHPTSLRVFSAGGSRLSAHELRPGLRIRFALEPGTGTARRVVLIYVEGGS